MNHTPTPWTIGQYQREIDEYGEEVLVTGIYSSADGVKVAKMEVWMGDEYRKESDENAEFVVRACNAHEELVALLKRLVAWDSNPDKYNDNLADITLKAQNILATIEKGA